MCNLKINSHHYGQDKKVFSLTLDNAFVNDVLQNTLRSQLRLKNDLICGGEFFHVHFCAHLLKLIVQGGLKVFGDAFDQIKNNEGFKK